METFVPCVWMDAGVLSFKLCDRNLECENCLLDQALRGLVSAEAARLEAADQEAGEYDEIQAEPGLPGFRLQRRFFYSPGHVWATVESRGRLRLGLDDFAQQLLGPVYRVSLPEPGTVLGTRRPLASVITQIGEFSLTSPVEGRVVWTNQQLLTRPGLVNRAPHTLGSLMVVEPRDLQHSLRDLKFGEAAHEWLAEESQALSASLMALVEAGRPQVGDTLPDGGAPSPELLRWLRSEPTFVPVVERFLRFQPPNRKR